MNSGGGLRPGDRGGGFEAGGGSVIPAADYSAARPGFVPGTGSDGVPGAGWAGGGVEQTGPFVGAVPVFGQVERKVAAAVAGGAGGAGGDGDQVAAGFIKSRVYGRFSPYMPGRGCR